MWTITLGHSLMLPSMQSEAMTLAMMERIAIDDLVRKAPTRDARPVRRGVASYT